MDINNLKLRYGIVGQDEKVYKALDTAIQIAPTDLTVLIQGESGVGKEVIPRIIHDCSKRRNKRYIAINCGSIPEGTIDSELFGHEKGSFTGAIGEREGYFGAATGGTLFRDDPQVVDIGTRVFRFQCLVMPTFSVATLLKLIFGVNLGWFEIAGLTSARYYDSLSDFGKIMNQAWHLVLPTVTIVIISIGSLMRYTRTNMLEVLNADYIRTARAKGLPEKKVINYHAFRNTLIPVVTILGGSLPSLFSGALITEQLFSIPGIGYTAYQSMIVGDIPFTMFYLSFMAILTLLGNLIADILYAGVDPRVRLS